MQTIEFVLRSRVRVPFKGSLTGESGNTTIFLQTGDQVSLHLARHQVAGYEREGSNLIVKLADGREIVLSDYFSGDAGEKTCKADGIFCVVKRKRIFCETRTLRKWRCLEINPAGETG